MSVIARYWSYKTLHGWIVGVDVTNNDGPTFLAETEAEQLAERLNATTQGAVEDNERMRLALRALLDKHGDECGVCVDAEQAIPAHTTGGQSDQIKTSRTDALNVACPRCAAAPGQPCTGARGKTRESMHRERHQALSS